MRPERLAPFTASRSAVLSEPRSAESKGQDDKGEVPCKVTV